MTISKDISRTPSAFLPAIIAASERSLAQDQEHVVLTESIFRQLTQTVELLQTEQAALKIGQATLLSAHRQEVTLLEERYKANQATLSTLPSIENAKGKVGHSINDLERRIAQLVLSATENSAPLVPFVALSQPLALRPSFVTTLPVTPSPFQQALHGAASRHEQLAEVAQRAELQTRTELIATIKRLYAENCALKAAQKQASWEHQKKIAPLSAKVEAIDRVLRIMRQQLVSVSEMAAKVFPPEEIDRVQMVEAYQTWALQRALSDLCKGRFLAGSNASLLIEEASLIVQRGDLEKMALGEVDALRRILARWMESPLPVVIDAQINTMLAETSPWMLLRLLAQYARQAKLLTIDLAVEDLGNLDAAFLALPAYLSLKKIHGKCQQIDLQQLRGLGQAIKFIEYIHTNRELRQRLIGNYKAAYTAVYDTLAQQTSSLFHKVDRELKRWQSCIGTDFRYIPQINAEKFGEFGDLKKALDRYHTHELQLKPYLTEKVAQEWAKQRQMALMQGEEGRSKITFTLPIMDRNIVPETPNAYIRIGELETRLLPLKAHVNSAVRPDASDIRFELFGLGRFECTYTFAIEDTPPKELYPAFTVKTAFRASGDSSPILLGTKKFTWGGNVNTINWYEVYLNNVFPLRITKWWEHVEQRETSRASSIPDAMRTRLLLAERDVVRLARLKAYQASCPAYLKKLEELYFHFYIMQAFVNLMGDDHAIRDVSLLHPDTLNQHLEGKGFHAVHEWLPPLPETDPLEARLSYLAYSVKQHPVLVRLKQYLRELTV